MRSVGPNRSVRTPEATNTWEWERSRLALRCRLLKRSTIPEIEGAVDRRGRVWRAARHRSRGAGALAHPAEALVETTHSLRPGVDATPATPSGMAEVMTMRYAWQ
jgi:hypothetical protein